MTGKFSLGLLLLFISISVLCQETFIAAIEIDAGNFNRYDTPVCTGINELGLNTSNKALVMYEITSKGRYEVSIQLEPGVSSKIWWILSGETRAGNSRKYELYYGESSVSSKIISTCLDDNSIKLFGGNKLILQYNHTISYPPEGVDSIYKRSGFIHPLWSPSGNILSRINPPDHYHHMGVWNPWTKTHYKDQEIDFWNLNKGQGTVKFSGYNSFTKGQVFGGFSARHEHIGFLAPAGDINVLNETWDIRAWNISLPGKRDAYLIEFTSLLSCATDETLMLDAYRYGGGIGFRANSEWTNANSWTLTSEGKTREDADATRARWADIGGEFEAGGSSGILFLSHPSNREHPEPMRVWPVNSNGGRGDVFFEFCPIRHKSWELKPGHIYSQKYRMLVYDGKIVPETAERMWNDFAYPPIVRIINN